MSPSILNIFTPPKYTKIANRGLNPIINTTCDTPDINKILERIIINFNVLFKTPFFRNDSVKDLVELQVHSVLERNSRDLLNRNGPHSM